jgi:hypothetical protein
MRKELLYFLVVTGIFKRGKNVSTINEKIKNFVLVVIVRLESESELIVCRLQ